MFFFSFTGKQGLNYNNIYYVYIIYAFLMTILLFFSFMGKHADSELYVV